MQETQVQFLGQEDPLEEEMATHFPESSTDRGACQATVHGVARARQDLATKPSLAKTYWEISFVAVVQLLSHVRLFAIPWIKVLQASLSFTIFWSLLILCPLSQ